MTGKMLTDILSYAMGARSVVPAFPLAKDEWRELYGALNKHDMAHFAGYALRKAGVKVEDSEVQSVLDRATDTAAFRYMKINRDVLDITSALEEAGVPHILLKGSVIRKYYPVPWLRTSCDIDVLVKPCDTERAKAALSEELEYTYLSAWNYEISYETPSGTHIELHHTLCDGDGRENEILASVWERSHVKEGTSFTYEMSDEMYYFYHVAHMAKHFVSGGCGIRTFVDIWVLGTRVEFDKEKRYALLDAGGLLAFARAAEQLAFVWLGGAEHTALTEALEEFILSGGTYGTMENRVAVNQARHGSKASYLMSRIFLPYDRLKLSYPRLEGRRWLTPFYQVKRWFRLALRGRLQKSVREAKTTAALSDDVSRRTTELLKELGIE